MKTIVKIVVALVIITACFNAGRVAVTNYQFEDAVHEGLLFDVRASDAEIVKMIMKLAPEYDIPINPDDIHIKTVGSEVQVAMSYTKNIDLLPGIYARDWTFNPSSSTRFLTGSRRE